MDAAAAMDVDVGMDEHAIMTLVMANAPSVVTTTTTIAGPTVLILHRATPVTTVPHRLMAIAAKQQLKTVAVDRPAMSSTTS